MDFNQYPYFDDFTKNDKFYRILYRPSFAVQGRELTQAQSILQEQIRKFGNHIFENGAMVIPGQITYDNTIIFQKMVETYGSYNVDPAEFLGYTVVGEESGLEAIIVNVAAKNDTDPLTFYIKTNNSGNDGVTTAFWDGETIYRKDDSSIKAICQGVLVTNPVGDRVYDYSGGASMSSIDSGVYYIDGIFADVDKQSIIAGKYSITPTMKIGLRIYESVITPEDNPALTDNAQNEPNYAAPGAHRYKIELKLETLDVDVDPSNDFIELQRLENGRVVKEIRVSEYSELEKTFARRTFDESGDYTVNPFRLEIKEHLRDESVDQYKEGIYTAAEGGDATKLVAELSHGKAYVQGFEIEKISKSLVTLDRARDYEIANNAVTNFLLGNYVVVDHLNNIPRIDTMGRVQFYDTPASPGTFTGTNIGSARVRAIVPLGVSTGLVTTQYRVYLFDVQMLDDGTGSKYKFEQVQWLYDSNEVGTRNFTAEPVLEYGLAVLYDTYKNNMLYLLPNSMVKTLAPGGSLDTTYDVTRVYYNVGVIANEVTLTAQANEVFHAYSGVNYIVANMSIGAGGALINTQNLTFALSGSPTGKNLTIGNIPVGVTNISIFATVAKTLASQKTKKLQEDAEIVITNPNKVAKGRDYVGKADMYALKAVVMSQNFTTAPSWPMGANDVDITSRYQFDTGQRDNMYDLGSIILLSGQPAPTGQIRIIFDYFTHTAGDYFSVDSYVDIAYDKIPVYNSRESGANYLLSDTYDFRPRIDDTGNNFTGAGASIGDVPIPNSNLRSDYEYYLNRIDKLYLDKSGIFKVVRGVPAVYPEPPSSPETGMVIYILDYNAYTLRAGSVDAQYQDNRRYTMRDIGKIDKRLKEVEYYTALSLLERETASMDITDEAGDSRFKNGFIVDPFTSHGIGEASHVDYSCSVDPKQGQMRPKFKSNHIPLIYNATDSLNERKTGPLITLDYSDTPVIQQLKGSVHENINPFAVRTYKGEVKFNPDSDNWYDTTKVGTLTVNNDAHFEALKFIAENTDDLNGITWNDWETQWSSSSSKSSSSSSTSRTGNRDAIGIPASGSPAVFLDEWHRAAGIGAVQQTSTTTVTTTTTTKQKRTGLKTVPRETTINKNMGDRTVGINYIPYMRSIPVLIKVEKMKPNTIVYPFFDDIAVDAHCQLADRFTIESKTGKLHTKYTDEETITGETSGTTATVVFSNDNYVTVLNVNGTPSPNEVFRGAKSDVTFVFLTHIKNTLGAELRTGDKGEIALVFTIPNVEGGLQFKTGERDFVLNDQVTNADANQTYAKGTFKSQGSMLQQEGTVLSTRTIRFDQEPVEQQRTLVSTSTSSSSSSTWYDPLAETFLIEEPGGCFLTKLDVYFQSKDPDMPVTCQIREVVNGYPGTKILPYSEITLNSENVTISAKAPGEPTTFEFDAPVYVKQGTEYCFVLMTDSFEYNVWVGEVGQIDLVTGEMISKQPYNGVLFKSQNASTWSANQQQDAMFAIYKAVFDIDNPASVVLENDSIPLELMLTNPIVTMEQNNRVRVIKQNHGLAVGSTFYMQGFEGGTSYNGFLGSDLNGEHTVVDTEIDTFVIEMGSDAAETGSTGGAGIYGLSNYQLDVLRPDIAEMILPDTYSDWQMQSVTGQSVSGDQIPHDIIPYVNILNNENYYMTVPAMVCSPVEETNNVGTKSLKLRTLLQSDNRNISPVVDMSRAACIGVANRIDKPQTSLLTCVAPSAGPPVVIGTFLINPGEDELLINHPGHELGEGAYVKIAGFADTLDTVDFDPNGWHQIRVLDKDNYLIDMGESSTVGYTRDDGNSGDGGCTIEFSTTHYDFVPEFKGENCSTAARYLTKQVSLNDPAESFRLMFGAVKQDNANIRVFFKIKNAYDPTEFREIDWIEVTEADGPIPTSDNRTDFKDHEYTVNLVGGTELFNQLIPEPFTSVAVKLVMESTDSTQVPIFTDFRLICLG